MTVWTFLLLLLVGGAFFIVIGSVVALKLHGERAAFKENYQRFHFNKRTAIAISTARSSIKFKMASVSKTYLISPDLQPPVAGSAPRWVDAAVTLKPTR
ncbi:hypothetical protein [Xanthomonas axonopodis]|uniref:hypothetical protein n=1 Tax=Xanthomonas axonopodis TaxID=53413 RepID=UPI0020163D80|nr:hypothetical protein [Xanthomonas axonopodis]